MSDERRLVDSASSGVQTEQIGTADQLVELSIIDHVPWIEIGDLSADTDGPLRNIPLSDRRDRRGSRRHGSQDSFRLPA